MTRASPRPVPGDGEPFKAKDLLFCTMFDEVAVRLRGSAQAAGPPCQALEILRVMTTTVSYTRVHPRAIRYQETHQ